MSSTRAGKNNSQPTAEACGDSRESRAPGRKRCPVTHQCILDAARELLEEIGFAAMTIEGIAARAGVGKATIYRRWPSKAGIVMDAFLAANCPDARFPDTGSVREDIRRQIRSLVKVMNSPSGRTIATLIGGGQMDEELAEAFRSRYLAARREEAKRVIRRGVESGELRADADPEVALDALYGPVYYRLLVGHGSLTPKYADALVDLVMDGLAA
ncbi:MAG TPA: TetR/AcrR family transcriptional regulator [Blastocatellia bacterium]|nr:TetR/AcrR family transcriptional regulator [Blastocatellia bacterium]